jgi:hypothetical protein
MSAVSPDTEIEGVSGLAVGDCFVFVPGSSTNSHLASEVDCADSESREVIALIAVPGTAYPGSNHLEEIAWADCYADAGTAQRIGYILPTEAAWASGHRTIVCQALP